MTVNFSVATKWKSLKNTFRNSLFSIFDHMPQNKAITLTIRMR